MDQILLGLGAAGAALLIIAIAVAAWEHRRHRAEMRLQRAWSENTRELLQAHARDVDARLATLAAAVHAQRGPAQAPEQAPVEAPVEAPVQASVNAPAGAPAQAAAAAPAQAASKTSQTRITAAATAQAGIAAAALATAQAAVKTAANQPWIETEPMVLTSQVLTPESHWPQMPDFDPTMPAELSEH